MKKEMKFKFFLLIIFLIFAVCYSFYFPYHENSYFEIKIIEEIYNIKINDSKIKIYFSYPNLISSLISICLYDSLEFFPESLNNEIFNIIDKNKIIKLLEDKKIKDELNQLNKLKISVNTIFFNDYYTPYIFLKIFDEKNIKLSLNQHFYLYDVHLSSYNVLLSARIYKIFYENFYYQLYKIFCLIKSYLECENFKQYFIEILNKNITELNIKNDFNIIFNIELTDKNKSNKISYASKFLEIDNKYVKEKMELIGLKYSNSFYNENMINYEGYYIITFFPFSNIDINKPFEYVLSHEFFHLYQSINNFYFKLENFSNNDNEIKNMIDKYFSIIKKIYLDNEYIIKNSKELNIIFNFYPSFSLIYDNLLFTHFFSDISSFCEISADIYALWSNLKNNKFLNFNMFYLNKRFLDYTNIVNVLKNIDNIDDIGIWINFFKIYLNYLLYNITTNIDELLKRIETTQKLLNH